MSKQTFIASMTGYKATDKTLACQGHTFEVGKWYEIDGEIELCKRGFHFCVHASGPWCYYNDLGTRIFTVEAEQVLEVPTEAGADFKLVAQRIRLVTEVTPGMIGNDKSNTGYRNTGNRNTGDCNTGDWNTGNRNTGDCNTGDWNTGNRNTGNRNTGNRNTGDCNTGDWNTGYRNTDNRNTGDRNTGYRNTGNRNTGDWNTGNRNTGDWNTGDRNTGDRNTGDCNTGNWNTGSRVAGFFCAKDPCVVSFDMQTKLTHDAFLENYPEAYRLGELLVKPEPIAIAGFKRIPGITQAKLDALHKRFLAARKQQAA